MSINNNNCIFCKIISKNIPSYKIFENKFVYAFLNINPISVGHILIITKKHFNNFIDADDHYLSEIIKAQKIISKNIYKILKPEGMNYLINEHEIAGQSVFHLHIHIIPKYKNNTGLNTKFNIINFKDFENIQKKITLL